MRLAAALLLIPTLSWAEVEITFKRPSRVMLAAPSDFTSYEMPIGSYSNGVIQTLIAEGPGLRKTWRVRLNGDGTLDLMDALRETRREIASAHGIPPYVIFHDATLVDMIQQRPQRVEDLLQISGIGQAKLEKYGQIFLDIIHQFQPAR